MIDNSKTNMAETLEDGEKTGLEAEERDDSVEITRPFDPEKIKVVRETKTIDLLLTRIEHFEIDLAPEFQRRARIWDNGRKSRLIESLLLKIPLPVFYVASNHEENWSVVDGLQRFTTIFDYSQDEFRLGGLEYLTQFNGNLHSELPRNMQRRIAETELVINVIQPGTPEEVMYNIFSRINTGGMTLTGQEIRHALNKGPAREFLERLANKEAFLAATDYSINDKRMAARECVLRFLAFWMTPWDKYDANDLDGFLNSAMKDLNHCTQDELAEFESKFDYAMQCAFDIFGNDAFRKRYFPEANRNPISKALFESWSVNFAGLSSMDYKAIALKKSDLKDKFMHLMKEDREFEVAISNSTGAPARVRKRFSSIENLIRELLI